MKLLGSSQCIKKYGCPSAFKTEIHREQPLAFKPGRDLLLAAFFRKHNEKAATTSTVDLDSKGSGGESNLVEELDFRIGGTCLRAIR